VAGAVIKAEIGVSKMPSLKSKKLNKLPEHMALHNSFAILGPISSGRCALFI
jgi:hypothetical protein